MGRDTINAAHRRIRARFQSTRPRWGATRITIRGTNAEDISIHTPQVGRDVLVARWLDVIAGFQSTRPRWGATVVRQHMKIRKNIFQSTRPRWGATEQQFSWIGNNRISIHTPQVGRDWSSSSIFYPEAEFQSTRPRWGATLHCNHRWNVKTDFNPHAPGGARRHSFNPYVEGSPNFNPHAPGGARRCQHLIHPRLLRFQSTRPRWGATGKGVDLLGDQQAFQSTRPRWGATK